LVDDLQPTQASRSPHDLQSCLPNRQSQGWRSVSGKNSRVQPLASVFVINLLISQLIFSSVKNTSHSHISFDMGGPPAQTMAEPDVHTAVSLRPRPTFSHRRSNSLGEHSNNDVELQSLPGYNEANDPYSLRHGLKSADELGRIKANTSRKRKICVPESVEKGAKERQLKAFYETQNENIERLLKPVDDHVREAKEKQESESLQYKIAVHGSFIVCLPPPSFRRAVLPLGVILT
jgi:hypothetical protein